MTDELVGEAPLRVLVVDDDGVARVMVRRALSHLGHADVQDFACGEDALAACDRTTFDVAIFDLDMPGINGVDLAGRVTDLFPALRFFFVSADLGGDLAARARALKPSGVLAKPWQPEELLRLVRGQ
jgi:CheY-like chemotaxis protein